MTPSATSTVPQAKASARRRGGRLWSGSRVPSQKRTSSAASHPANQSVSTRLRLIATYRRASARTLRKRPARVTLKKKPTSDRKSEPVASGVKWPSSERLTKKVS